MKRDKLKTFSALLYILLVMIGLFILSMSWRQTLEETLFSNQIKIFCLAASIFLVGCLICYLFLFWPFFENKINKQQYSECTFYHLIVFYFILGFRVSCNLDFLADYYFVNFIVETNILVTIGFIHMGIIPLHYVMFLRGERRW